MSLGIGPSSNRVIAVVFSITIALAGKWKVCFLWIDKFWRLLFNEVPNFYCGSKTPSAHVTFLQKRLRKHRFHNARYAVCFVQPISSTSKKSSWLPLWLRFLYLRSSRVRQPTFNRTELLRHLRLRKQIFCKTWVYIRTGSGCRPLLEWLIYVSIW